MPDREEEIYEQTRRHVGDMSVSSLQKMHQDDIVREPSLIERQMRDLKMSIDDTDLIIVELYEKFAPILAEDLSVADYSTTAIDPMKSTNSEHLEMLNRLESTVVSQHRRLRTLMERCEI